MKIAFVGGFSERVEPFSSKVPAGLIHSSQHNLLIDSPSREETEGGTSLYLWGKIINLQETARVLGKQTDTSLRLLDLFLAYPAESILPLIDGNFTGILIQGDTTLIFRDKNGGGPAVYYSRHHFSSHVDGLRIVRQDGFEPDLESISFFLGYGYIPSPKTAFQGISKIPSGYFLTCNKDLFTLTNAFPFSDFISGYPNLKISEKEAAEHLSDLHRNAIKRRIAGEPAVGILLSGGFDSGGNLARLRDVFSGEVSSFSIGFKGNPMSELPYARQFAEHFGTHHIEYEMDGHEIEFLPEMIRGFGDPFQENGLMLNLSVMKLLKEHHFSSTTLCGEGNDRQFGVHSRELAIHFLAGRTGLNVIQKGINRLAGAHPFLPDNQVYRIQFHNNRILNIFQPDRFGFNSAELKVLFSKPISIPPAGSLIYTGSHYHTFEELYLEKTYFIDIQQTINEIIAYKAVRAAEVFGNTLAFPLLDMDIYRFIKQLPIPYRIHGSLYERLRGKGISKYIYKASLKGKLPEKAVSRKKQGGFAPMRIFFNDETRLKGIFRYILHSDMTHHLFNQDALNAYFDRFGSEIKQQRSWFWYDQFHCFQVFSLLILALWWDQLINNKPFLRLSEYIEVKAREQSPG